MSGALTPAQRGDRLSRYYDLDFCDVAYDAELYQQLAHQSGGAVLELGVGSGRLGVPLALGGHEVLGVDNDEAMLQRARLTWQERRGELEADRFQVETGDFLTYRSERRFGVALIAVNTFLLAEDDEQRRSVLVTMREHLRPGGLAVVEVGTPDEAELDRYDRRLQHEWLRFDPETGEEVSKVISANYDPGDQSLELTQIYEWTPTHGGPLSRVAKTDLLHLISAEHLGELAREAGFAAVDLWGDHLLIPHGAGSHRVILVARGV
jgi:protein-L-isoaspartate O-methyltransferase